MQLFVTKEEARKLLIILRNAKSINGNEEAELLAVNFSEQLGIENFNSVAPVMAKIITARAREQLKEMAKKVIYRDIDGYVTADGTYHKSNSQSES